MSTRLILTLLVLTLATVAHAQSSEQYPGLHGREIVFAPEIFTPPEAEQSGLSGTVNVLAVVDRDGNVVSIEKVTGPGYVCSSVTREDVVAMRSVSAEAARSVKFAPTDNGKPALTESWIRIEFPDSAESLQSTRNGKVNEKPVRQGLETGSPKVKVEFGTSGPLLADFLRTANSNTKPASQATQTSSFVNANYKVGGNKVSGGVLNPKALSLGVPKYPAAARMVKASGTLLVNALVDSNGEVFSATPVYGHPLLLPATLSAACKSKFAPVVINDQPAMTYGVITYNFVF